MDKLIITTVKDSIATLTFNKPDQLNALDEPMGKAFSQSLKQIRNDPSIRALIITGAGRAFSSGGNLSMLESKIKKSQTANKAELKRFYRTFLEVRDLDIPVIAAINGPAVGAGFCLALACDFRFAAESSKMGANFARLGLAPGMGGTYLITRLVGPLRAAEILMTAHVFDARTAEKFGLVNGVSADAGLMPLVINTAKLLASNAPLSMAMIKRGIQKAQHASLEQMFNYDSAAQAKCFTTQDIKEGIAAIRDKRNPIFTGK